MAVESGMLRKWEINKKNKLSYTYWILLLNKEDLCP